YGPVVTVKGGRHPDIFLPLLDSTLVCPEKPFDTSRLSRLGHLCHFCLPFVQKHADVTLLWLYCETPPRQAIIGW
ncbi:hypothetical protein J6590_098917, partial [Homalodisca vitripennis]